MNSTAKFDIKGFVKITDVLTQQILLEKCNAVNFENLSIAIAQSLGAGPLNAYNSGFIYTMNFGNGGTTVNSAGIVTYNPPNVVGTNAQLYNQTYSKVVNNQFASDIDVTNNNITYAHVTGKAYTDIIVKCRLDYGEPADQLPYDNSNYINSEYAFDELGLFTYNGQLLTHLTYSPIVKSLNRLIDITYTLRISTLSSLSV